MRGVNRVALVWILLQAIAASTPQPARGSAPVVVGETDEYTRYELLAPETGTFKETFEVSVTAPGARDYTDHVLPGTEVVSESAVDLMTGGSLDVRKTATSHVVVLARPVPPNGQGRLGSKDRAKREKCTPARAVSWSSQKRSAAAAVASVLPAGFELLSCNVPAQVLSEPDGRIGVAYMNQMDRVSLVLKARSGIAVGASAAPKPLTDARSWEPPPAQGPTERARLAERAHQDRDITYFLNDSATSSFSLFHDYTESRPGIDKYINVVREGSRVSKPSAYILDTGEKLADETLKGPEITAAKLDIGQPVSTRYRGRSRALSAGDDRAVNSSANLRNVQRRLKAIASMARIWSSSGAWAAAQLGRAAGRLVSHRVVHLLRWCRKHPTGRSVSISSTAARQHRRPHQGPPPAGPLTRSLS